jgi:hypothetical protein
MQFAPGRLRYGREKPPGARPFFSKWAQVCPRSHSGVFTMPSSRKAARWLSGTHCAGCVMGPGSAPHHFVLRCARDDNGGLQAPPARRGGPLESAGVSTQNCHPGSRAVAIREPLCRWRGWVPGLRRTVSRCAAPGMTDWVCRRRPRGPRRARDDNGGLWAPPARRGGPLESAGVSTQTCHPGKPRGGYPGAIMRRPDGSARTLSLRTCDAPLRAFAPFAGSLDLLTAPGMTVGDLT